MSAFALTFAKASVSKKATADKTGYSAPDSYREVSASRLGVRVVSSNPQIEGEKEPEN